MGAVRGGGPKNELKGRDVMGEPLADKRRGRPKKYGHISNEDLRAKALELAAGKSDLSKKDNTMYKELRRRGILDETFGARKRRKRKYGHVGDEDLKAKAQEMADSRTDLSEKDHTMYKELKNRELLDETFGPKKKCGKKTVKTPGFIFKFYPDAPERLPIEAVKRLNESLKEVKNRGYGNSKDKYKWAIYLWVNNFCYNVTHFIPHLIPEKMKRIKIGELYTDATFKRSGLLNSQTYEEFLETVKKVMKECGLSYEKVRELSGTIEGSLYVLPAFLKLLEMGYKDYPDLSA